MSRITTPSAAKSVSTKTSKPTVPANDEGLRIIKKYPNRRLYDTNSSSYITLAQVRQLVMERERFVVRDAKTGDDLTRSILLQIILEEEAGGAPMFTETMLSNIIRFYGHALQGFMGSYLEKNIQSFMEIQAKLSEQSQGLSPELWTQFMHMQSPLMQGMMGQYLENNITAFSDMQKKLQDQAKHLYGDNAAMSKDLWAQFLNFQGPAMQSMMGTYVEQSQKMFQQMQDSIQEQTKKMFSGFQFPSQPAAEKVEKKK